MRRMARWTSFVALLTLVLTANEGCLALPTDLSEDDARSITGVVVRSFIEGFEPNRWPQIYLSNEFLSFAVDSAWLATVSSDSLPIVVATRAQATTDYENVRNGGLLIEPFAVVAHRDGRVTQALGFTATSDFGGQLSYTVRPDLRQGWRVTRVRVDWIQ